MLNVADLQMDEAARRGPDSKALSVYIGYLRRKTEAGGKARLLYTVRGVGYTLREP